jgi:hypothetical protein
MQAPDFCEASLRMRSSTRSRRAINVRKRIRFLTRLFVCFGIATIIAGCGQSISTSQTAETVVLAPPNFDIPLNYFGLHILHLIQYKDTNWPNVPFGTWHLWDAHVSWNFLEPQRGVYDFSLLDQYVTIAQQRNVDLVLTLAVTPPWADNGVDGGTAPPSDINDWKTFVDVIAHRYAGKIHYYEIWNEPDHSAWYTGTLSEMLAMHQAAYAAIKAADPTNKVLSPPVNGDAAGLAWLNQYLAAGAGQYIDIYSFHLYVGSYPETMVPKYQGLQSILAQYGESQKPVWNTEAGWPFYTMTTELSAEYVARAYLVNWALGLQRFTIYAWDHPRLGIAPGGVDTPMTAAYTQVGRWLLNAKMTQCIEYGAGVWIADITFANGAQAKIAWYPSGTTELDPSHVNGAVDYQTLDGQTVKIGVGGAGVQVSRSPILLEFPAQ